MKIRHSLLLSRFFAIVWAASTCAQPTTFQLAPPYLHCASVFFEKEARVTLEFAQAGTRIHYTINSLGPTENDAEYTAPIWVRENLTTLQARVFGDGFLPSETVWATFFQRGIQIESITSTPPHEQYPGNGSQTLIDGQGGIKAFQSKTWMGFKTEEITVYLTLKKPKKIKQVLLHLLQNQDAWIFLPSKIEVYGATKKGNAWVLLDVQKVGNTVRAKTANCQAIFTNIGKPLKIKEIMLKISPLAQLPEWHPGKGNPAWLFLDEIILY